jgi:acetylornithine/N-succinyldiaminopimelate aminotransferase
MPAPMMDTYAPPELVFDHGKGARLVSDKGDSYLDFISGIAVNCLGHAHPKAVAALTGQAEKLWHLSNMFKVPAGVELAKKLTAATFADRVFFTNSGAEAVECSLKTARKYQYDNGHPERYRVITFKGAFHGRTYGAINAGGNPAYLKGFGPALEGFDQVEFGDLDAVKNTITEETGAIIVEPVQGEGGVRAPEDSFLRGLRQLCDDNGLMLIYDEVQSGAGRTGKLFAHQWVEGAEPDIMAIAKGIGGGFPMGACLATEAASAGMVVGTHGSTYGGGPLAMAVGNVVIDELTADGFLDHVVDVSNFMRQQLHGLADRHADKVIEVRGKGLLIGLQLKLGFNPKKLAGLARDRKLLIGAAGDNVARMAPPLIITKDDASEAVAILDEALGSLQADG